MLEAWEAEHPDDFAETQRKEGEKAAQKALKEAERIKLMKKKGRSAAPLDVRVGDYAENHLEAMVGMTEQTKDFIAHVKAGKLKVIKKLLKSGADPNSIGMDSSTGVKGGMSAGTSQNTPLLEAVDSNQEEIAKMLLDGGANPNLMSSNVSIYLPYDDEPFTAHEMGMKEGEMSLGMCMSLITPMMAAARYNTSGKDGRLSMVKLLIACGAEVNIIVPHGSRTGWTAFHYACDAGNAVRCLEESFVPRQ